MTLSERLDLAGRSSCLEHLTSGEVEGNKDEILEGARPEQRPVASANTNRFAAQEPEESIEHIQRALTKFRVPETESKEFLALFSILADEIIER